MALSLNNRIPVPTGIKEAKDIRIGDYVFTANGQKTAVIDVQKRTNVPSYRFELTDGRYCICSKDQLWYIYHQDGMVKSTIIANTGDIRDLTEKNHGTRYRMIENRAVPYKFQPVKDLEKDINTIKKKDDSIPVMYMINTTDIRTDMIRQLFDIKGTIENVVHNRFSYETKDIDTANSIRYLLWSLGFHGEVTYKKKFFVTIRKMSSIIKSITPIGLEDCVDIMVESKEHLFLCEDFIVTHDNYVG